jgi:acyl-CoA reductase-like NAD-dependent aldehyde dehydrogenase
MRGTLPRALHRATRETGSTRKQESVTDAAVFLSRAARNLEDLDGSRAAPVGTREVVLARHWGFALVVFQWSFVLLLIIGELASAACLNLAALDLAVCRSVIKA